MLHNNYFRFMNGRIFSSLFIIIILFISCQNGKSPDKRSENKIVETKNNIEKKIESFPLPTIPTMLSSPKEREKYLVQHYWDNFDFNDTSYIHRAEITEQGWVNYIDLLKQSPLPEAQRVIKAMMRAISTKNTKVFKYFTELADKYLYDPNSPLQEEELYIPILEVMVKTPTLSDAEKIRPKDRLKLALKNRVGQLATDFSYTLISGIKTNLYRVPGEFTLLFFNNPGCHACEETINKLKFSVIINQLITNKRLKIVAIYPDAEIDEWQKHINDFPKEWINGYDKGVTIKTKNIYDLKAIPTLYLLDKEKKVLLKDAFLPEIELYFKKHNIL